jgi:hypothetical protein
MLNKEGEVGINAEGLKMTIVFSKGSRNINVEFENGYVAKNRTYNDFKKGEIKNKLHPSVYKIGYEGVGIYSSKKHPIPYTKWTDLLKRCYSKSTQERQPTYKGCSVDERWYNFQNFAEWFENNYIKGWHLDKDILMKGNKIYSPETCCFVPQEINALFLKSQNKRGTSPVGVFNTVRNNKYTIGITLPNGSKSTKSYDTAELAFEAYKNTKEAYIKEVADKWKDQIDLRVYQAMYNYKVEITD